MRTFIKNHVSRINWYVSLAGMAGLGHLTFWEIDHKWPGTGLVISFCLVFCMACSKIYLDHVVTDASFWPRRKRTS
jgi:hypothetical protein